MTYDDWKLDNPYKHDEDDIEEEEIESSRDADEERQRECREGR